MPRKITEKMHIEKEGQRFTEALARSTMVVRSCEKLIGLDKIRAPIAWQAALKATGFIFHVDGFVFPKSVAATVEMNEIANDLFRRAVEAAAPRA